MEKFTFIDLFSGIGGFHLGATRNGGKSIGFSEIDKTAINYYCSNYNIKESNNFGNITKIKNVVFIVLNKFIDIYIYIYTYKFI